ncbi:MAG TPA: 3-hydroxyacyl-CoA dehydrogenase, partial [Bacteroidetes bacterium]|nr:3-hydroxyacyl-CoA dehydrogenase [Bacteroidota bacterium]
MDNLFRYTLGDDGIAMITIDQKDNPANLFSFEFIDAYLEVAGGAVADDRVRGVIVTSARRIFMAGADLRELAALDANSEFIFNKIMETHRRYRAIETGGKPFVAAINGTALGGGMELCLTCHHRIVLDQPDIKLGFPEVRVGLLPGGGGTAKLPYLLGLQNGLTYLLQGTQARPPKALKDGLVDEVAATHEEMLAAARKWITENPNPVQPWDDPHYHLPGGGLMTPSGAQIMMAAIARVRQQTRGNYPNVQYILSTVHDGLQVSIDRALETEARYFTKALRTKEAKNMIRTGFLEMQAAQKGKARPKGIAKYEVKKLGIIGAGMMGGGIACVSARAGMEVVLTDITPEKAAAGKSYSEKVLDKALAKGRTTPEKVSALMARIHPAVGVGAMKGCDLVVEAVFEDLDLKHRVLKETESVLDAG